MSKSIKGVVLSGLVFPGLGQIVQKRYKLGITLILTVIVSCSVLVARVVQQAYTILEKIESEGGEINLSTILDMAKNTSSTCDNVLSNLLYFAIFVSWIVGIVDAYRIGKKMDKEK